MPRIPGRLATRLRRIAFTAGPRHAGARTLDAVADLARVALPGAERGTCHVGAFAPSLQPTVFHPTRVVTRADFISHSADPVS